MRNSICKFCDGVVKNYYSERCQACYFKTMSSSGNPNWKGSSICQRCGGARERHNKSKLCGDCYRREHCKGLPRCIGCGNSLSSYKALIVGTGYCQKCYRGKITKRWNPNLTDEERLAGRTINPAYYQWRLDVFERDNYSCQQCGDNKGGNLIAHHLACYSKNKDLRTDLGNGITLCQSCHLDFHKTYGYFNNTKEQIEEYIGDL